MHIVLITDETSLETEIADKSLVLFEDILKELINNKLEITNN